MIESISHKGLRLLWEKGNPSKLPPEQVEKIKRILSALNTAKSLEPLKMIPGYKLHPLSGELKGFGSQAITGSISGLRMAMFTILIMLIITDEDYGK